MNATPDALLAYPVVIQLPVQWGEMDAFGHVNNVIYFRYFESARIAFFDRIGFTRNQGVGPILHSTHCRFRRPLTYPDSLQVGARASDVAEDRFTLSYSVYSERLGEVAADGNSVVVAFDYAVQGKAALPSTIRQALDALASSLR